MTYVPEFYDAATPASLDGDVEWYCRKALESGGPVLELGAGTGRITLGIAEAGVDVLALDADAAMLGALRAKLAARPPEIRSRVTVVAADMRTFELPARYPLVIAPFRAFLHNVTEADRLACLDRVRRHLRTGGRFAFNVFHPSLEFMAQHAGALAGVWRWTGTHTLANGRIVMRSEANRYDTVRQIVHSQHRYDEYTGDGVLIRSTVQRLELAYLHPGDVRRVLEQAGFEDVRIAGGFDGRELSRDGDELVIEAVAGAS